MLSALTEALGGQRIMSIERVGKRVKALHSYREKKERKVVTKLTLPAEIRERAEYIGRGNMSRGIEYAVNLCMYQMLDIAEWEFQKKKLKMEKARVIAKGHR